MAYPTEDHYHCAIASNFFAVRSLKRIALQKQAKDAEVMSMAELEDIVRQGEKDIAEGNFQPIAIDDLWK